MTCSWKPDWEQTKKNLIRWWENEGMVLHLRSPRPLPVEVVPKPSEPSNLQTQWLDPEYRCAAAEFEMANHYYLAEAFPYFDTQIGPGSLGAFLGSGLPWLKIPFGTLRLYLILINAQKSIFRQKTTFGGINT